MEDHIIQIVLGIVLTAVALYVANRTRKKNKESHAPSEHIQVNINDTARRLKVVHAVGKVMNSPYKDYALRYIKSINESDKTAVDIRLKPAPITITYKYIDQSSIAWLASMIVHEARHVEQQWELGGYKNQESELDANRLQYDALKHFGGSASELNYLQNQDGLHFDTNGNGILDKDDSWKY